MRLMSFFLAAVCGISTVLCSLAIREQQSALLLALIATIGLCGIYFACLAVKPRRKNPSR